MYIVLEACYVPDGSYVTKPTGTKPYMLKRDVKIYGMPDNQQPVLPINADGIAFLFSDGEINAITEDSLVAVHFSNLAELTEWLAIRGTEHDEETSQ